MSCLASSTELMLLDEPISTERHVLDSRFYWERKKPYSAPCFMSDIATLHKTARSLILSIRDGLEQLERSESVSFSC